MLKAIQRIGILFILVVFLYGTTGLSVLDHSCNSSNERSVTIYPEIFKQAGSGCCTDGESGYACASHKYPVSNAFPENVDAQPCCKSIISFFKLEILTVRAEKLVVDNLYVQAQSFPVPADVQIPNEQRPLTPVHHQFYSPPLFGIRLVHFLHQMKIPAHLLLS
jgi:hypothetical protein